MTDEEMRKELGGGTAPAPTPTGGAPPAPSATGSSVTMSPLTEDQMKQELLKGQGADALERANRIQGAYENAPFYRPTSQALSEGLSFIGAAPAGINYLANRVSGGTGTNALTPYLGTPSSLLGHFQNAGMYDPNWKPKTFGDYMGKAVGYTAASLPIMAATVPAEMGLGGVALTTALRNNLLGAAIPEAAGQAAEYASGGKIPGAAVSLPLGFMMPVGVRELANWGDRRAAQKLLDTFTQSGELPQAQAAVDALEAGKPKQTTANMGERMNIKSGVRAAKQMDAATVEGNYQAGMQAANDVHKIDMANALAERDRVANTLGPHGQIQNAVPEAQQHMMDWWTKSFQPTVKSAREGLYAITGEDAPVKATNFLKSAGEEGFGAAGNLDPILQLFQGQTAAKVERILKGEAYAQGLPAGEAPDSTLRNLMTIRTAFGKALEDPTLLKDLPKAKIAEMYGAINDDIRSGLGNIGPAALKAFDEYNAKVKDLYRTAAIVNDGGISSATDATKNPFAKDFMKLFDAQGGDKMALLRRFPELGKALDTITGAVIRETPKVWDSWSKGMKTAMAGGDSKVNEITSAFNKQTEADALLAANERHLTKQKADDLQTVRNQAQDLRDQKTMEMRQNTLEQQEELAQQTKKRLEQATQKQKDLEKNVENVNKNKPAGKFWKGLVNFAAGAGGLDFFNRLYPHAAENLPKLDVSQVGQFALPILAGSLAAGGSLAAKNPRTVRNLLLNSPSLGEFVKPKQPGSTP